jgi:hypothetical protein
MALASKFPWMLLFASCVSVGLSVSSSSCIATDRIEFEPTENLPPSIISQPGAELPLNEIGQVNLDDPLPPERAAEILLQTIIRDPNFDQTLQYRIFLDSPPPPAAELPIQQGEVEAIGFLERPSEFFIPYEALAPGICHKIELVVVGQFASFVEPRRPVDPGDVDQVTWWIEVTDNNNPEITQACR